RPQAGQIRGAASDLTGEDRADLLSPALGRDLRLAIRGLPHAVRANRRVVEAALRDPPLEQPPGGRRGNLRAHARAARRLTEDRHVVRVTAERGDVVLNPPQ